MNLTKIITHVSERPDTYKLLASGGIVVVALVLFYAFADHSLLLRTIGFLLALAAAVVMALRTAIGQETLEFTQGSRSELRKMVWPTRQETLQTTLVVVAVVVIMGLFLWLLDVILLWLVRVVTT